VHLERIVLKLIVHFLSQLAGIAMVLLDILAKLAIIRQQKLLLLVM